MAAMARPMCWQLSVWMLRGWREVNLVERGGEDGVGGGGGEEAENRLKLHVERCFDSLLRSFLQEVLEGGRWRRRLNYGILLMTMV